MKRWFCLLVLIAFVGCQGLPPEKVRAGIRLTNAGVRDYVSHEQPEVEKRIVALRAALEASTDEADKATLRRMIADEEEYLRLGREIPPTLQELEDWAEGRPLRKKE
jgi:hypothetical protein